MVFIKGYFVLSRRGLLCLFFALCISAFIFSEFYAVGIDGVDASTNAKRLQFINSLNLQAEETCISQKRIIIPDNFSDVYKNYNLLQQEAGYDLSAYKGCSVTVFTYRLSEYNPFSQETVVNLFVYKGKIIAGDISATAFDGFMLPLVRKENWNK